MGKFLNRFLTKGTFVFLTVLGLVSSSSFIEAQITLRIDKKTVRISERSAPFVLRGAIIAVNEGRASLVVPPSRSRNRSVTLRLAGRSVTLPAAKSARVANLNPKSTNRKTAELSQKLIQAIGALLPEITTQEGQSNIEVPNNFVSVYKRYSYTQCWPSGDEVTSLDSELSRRGIKSVGSYCATSDNDFSSAVCGGPAFAYRVHVINRSQLYSALMAGFYPLEWLSTKLSMTSCAPAASQTTEMVGIIANLTCQPTQNTVEDFDRWLVVNGLKVLDSSCGYETFGRPPVCGQPDLVYRQVKINSNQRTLALQLGLRDRTDFSDLVKFGQECPAPEVVDSPPAFVELVGVISNVVCSPPQNTVAQFDKMLSDANITVLNKSCGYLKVANEQPCPDVFRAVTIPKSQEVFALILGLFNRSNVETTVSFGQSCPL